MFSHPRNIIDYNFLPDLKETRVNIFKKKKIKKQDKNNFQFLKSGNSTFQVGSKTHLLLSVLIVI